MEAFFVWNRHANKIVIPPPPPTSFVCCDGILHLRRGTRRHQSPSEGDGIVRVMLHSLMPHTNVLSQRKDHMTMYYISYSDY